MSSSGGGRVSPERVTRRLAGDGRKEISTADDLRRLVAALEICLLCRVDKVLPFFGGCTNSSTGLSDSSSFWVAWEGVRVDLRRLLGGWGSSGENISVSASTSDCRVRRRLFFFLGSSSAAVMLVFRKDRVVVRDSAEADFRGEVAEEGGNEVLRPTKTGHVGILFRCSILQSQFEHFKGIDTLDRPLVPSHRDRVDSRDNELDHPYQAKEYKRTPPLPSAH